jgi:hypothetical protein
MSSYTILIKSSSGGRYNVVFDIATFKTGCDCPAGMFGDLCKHLKTFFEADQSLLFCEALKNAEIYAAYAELQAGLKDLDRQKKALTAQGSVLKAAFVKRLKFDK